MTNLEEFPLLGSHSLERIGYGHCGSVWGTLSSTGLHSDTPIVIKREDASPGRDIKNEVSVQSQVNKAKHSQVLVPTCFGLMDSHDERWNQLLPLLPHGFTGCRAMISEKIEPVSHQAQRLLVKKYAPEQFRDKLEGCFEGGQREHCLVRMYLGRRRHMRQTQHRGPRFFSLRNFPLHADQVEELELPCEDYARTMAEAMAMLHWDVRTDAADVEFVLGACRGAKAEAEGVETPLAHHALWLLDFDCSRSIRADESGLEVIAREFWRNDPYFPQPDSAHEKDQKLWEIFAREYQRVGTRIVQTSPREGENVEKLCALVRGAIVKIVETKGKWRS